METVKFFFNYFYWIYLQYSFITALNIMDTYEQYLFNGIVVLIILLLIYSGSLFLQPQIENMYNLISEMF